MVEDGKAPRREEGQAAFSATQKGCGRACPPACLPGSPTRAPAGCPWRQGGASCASPHRSTWPHELSRIHTSGTGGQEAPGGASAAAVSSEMQMEKPAVGGDSWASLGMAGVPAQHCGGACAAVLGGLRGNVGVLARQCWDACVTRWGALLQYRGHASCEASP